MATTGAVRGVDLAAAPLRVRGVGLAAAPLRVRGVGLAAALLRVRGVGLAAAPLRVRGVGLAAAPLRVRGVDFAAALLPWMRDAASSGIVETSESDVPLACAATPSRSRRNDVDEEDSCRDSASETTPQRLW